MAPPGGKDGFTFILTVSQKGWMTKMVQNRATAPVLDDGHGHN